MEVIDLKQVVFKMDEELFKKAKIKAIQNNKTMTDYIVELIGRDLEGGQKECRAEMNL